jgi:hypothetical protein
MTCLKSSNVKLIEWNKEFDRKFFLDVFFNKTSYQYVAIIPGHTHYLGLKTTFLYIKNTLILLFLQSLGIKCIWVCKSLDTLPYLEQILEKLICTYIHQYSVRDSISNNNNKLDAEVWPDLSFLMPQNEHKIKSPFSKIIFSFRGDRREITESVIEQFCVLLIKQISETRTLDEIIFLVNVTFDKSLMKSLFEKIQDKFSIKMKLVENVDLIDIIDLYKENSVVFTDRLHVALPAMINNTPAYPFVDYILDSKIVGIYKDMGWEKFVIIRPSSINEFPDNVYLFQIEENNMLDVAQKIEKVRVELSSKIEKIFSKNLSYK